MTSYEEFLTNYADEMSTAIRGFKKIKVNKLTDEKLDEAKEKIDNRYDKGVSDEFEGFLYNKDRLSILSLANIALSNLNRYGTEMRMIISAIEDYTHVLS